MADICAWNCIHIFVTLYVPCISCTFDFLTKMMHCGCCEASSNCNLWRLNWDVGTICFCYWRLIESWWYKWPLWTWLYCNGKTFNFIDLSSCMFLLWFLEKTLYLIIFGLSFVFYHNQWCPYVWPNHVYMPLLMMSIYHNQWWPYAFFLCSSYTIKDFLWVSLMRMIFRLLSSPFCSISISRFI